MCSDIDRLQHGRNDGCDRIMTLQTSVHPLCCVSGATFFFSFTSDCYEPFRPRPRLPDCPTRSYLQCGRDHRWSIAFSPRPLAAYGRGGGRTRLLRDGAVFEQAAIGFSDVCGTHLPPSASVRRPELAGANWRACGVSLVFHPKIFQSLPHLNVRYFRAEREGKQVAAWFGGGLTSPVLSL